MKTLGPEHIDPPILQKIDVADYIPEEDGTIRLHISFPALPWAHAFMQLIDLCDDTLLESKSPPHPPTYIPPTNKLTQP